MDAKVVTVDNKEKISSSNLFSVKSPRSFEVVFHAKIFVSFTPCTLLASEIKSRTNN